MSSTFKTQRNRAFQLKALTVAMSATLALTACGGDTVDSISPRPDLGSISGTTEGNVNGSTGGTENQLALQVTDIELINASGKITQSITRNGTTATVKVTDSYGKPIKGAFVRFSGESIQFQPSNGAVITDSDGKASLTVTPTDSTVTGSYKMQATAEYRNKTVTTNNSYYNLQALNTVLKDLKVVNLSLDSGASTVVTLKTNDSNTNTFQNDVSVSFSASCGTFSPATVVSSNQGDVLTTYTAIDSKGNLCEGTQTIMATTPNSNTSVKQTVQVAPVEATSIIYSSQENITLGAKSSGSASTGEIQFTVYSNGTPASNQQIQLDLSKSPNDFSFIKLGNRDSKIVTSDASGNVKVTLYPGDIPGPVEIKAALVSNPQIFAVSKNVSVATNRPTQNGITIAFEENVLLNNKISSTKLTVALTDRQGNYVPKGTVVNFVSEGGTVTPSCSTNSVGQCQVTFTSQQPIPVNGRVSVVAFVEGDKTFMDTDGDNVYTVGIDTLPNNIGHFYRDDNENNKFDVGEFRFSRRLLGQSAQCAPSSFNQPNIDNTCDNQLSSILRAQTVIGLANDVPLIEYDNIEDRNNKKFMKFRIYGNEYKNMPMPSGTTISLNVEDRTEKNNQTCSAEIISGYDSVPKIINLGRYYNDDITNSLVNTFLNNPVVNYEIDLTGCVATDKIELVITPPDAGAIKTRINDKL